LPCFAVAARGVCSLRVLLIWLEQLRTSPGFALAVPSGVCQVGKLEMVPGHAPASGRRLVGELLAVSRFFQLRPSTRS
jgi:hypothetical protein